MKKIVKSSLLAVLLVTMLLALAGCGGNKIVATKTNDKDKNLLGFSYTETMEITFKKDKADKIVWTTECDDEKSAKTIAGLYQMASSELEDMKIEQKGKKVVITLTAKDFATQEDMDEDSLTKDALIKKLEEQGYTVKK